MLIELKAPTKAKKASKSMDFNGGIKFQIGTIKIHTLAHATANARYDVNRKFYEHCITYKNCAFSIIWED